MKKTQDKYYNNDCASISWNNNIMIAQSSENINHEKLIDEFASQCPKLKMEID